MSEVLRSIRVQDNLAFVPLTQGMEAVIDAADIDLISRRNWYTQPHGNTFYAVTTKRHGEAGPKTIRMHKLIIAVGTGLGVDHINGDGLDNRRVNLREATTAQNSRNVGPNSLNKSGFKGVCWHSRDKKWLAYIYVYKKKISLGRYDTIEEAHAAYCKAAMEHHGDFANIGSANAGEEA